MSTEAKVGAFTLAGLMLLAGVIFMLSGIRLGGEQSYTIYAGFSQVLGVKPQSTVRLAGVPVGSVLEIKNEGRGVTVAMKIDSDAKIPKGSAVTIGSEGVMGEKFINILPDDGSKGYVGNGDYLIGQDEAGMDTMFAGLSKAVGQVQELLTNMNNIIGNEALQSSMVQMVVNLRDTTAHINGMMAALEQMTIANQGNINGILTNLNGMTASLNRTASSVEAIMANLETVGADPQTAENLRLTLDNITATSQQIKTITEGIAKVAGDEQTVEDTKAIIHNTRNLTEKAGNLKKRLEEIKVKPQLDVLYSGQADDSMANFNLNIESSGTSLDLGVDDIGSNSKWNFTGGKRLGAFGARAGVIAGQAGVGADIYAGDKFKFSAEAYDTDDISVRLRAQYQLGDSNTYLLGQWNDVNDREHRRAYVGLRQTF